MLASHTHFASTSFSQLSSGQRRPSDNPPPRRQGTLILTPSNPSSPSKSIGSDNSPDGCPQVRGRDPEEEAVRRDSLPAPCPLLGGENPRLPCRPLNILPDARVCSAIGSRAHGVTGRLDRRQHAPGGWLWHRELAACVLLYTR